MLENLAKRVDGLYGGARITFAGRCLDEIGAGIEGKNGCPLDQVGRGERACLEDHLQFRLAAGVLDLGDLIGDFLVGALHEITQVHHDIDLVGALHDGHGDFGDLDLREGLRRRKTTGYRGDTNPFGCQRLADRLDEIGIDADRGDIGDIGPCALKVVHPVDHLPDALFRVERRE